MSSTDNACYHCGLPLPAGTHFLVVIDGTPRAMCCAGCQAVAQAIAANGLSDDITIIDMTTMQPVQSLPIGRIPHTVVIDD